MKKMKTIRRINLHLNSIHPGIRYRILKILCKFLGMTDAKFQVDFFGTKYSGQLTNHIDFLTFFFGAYELGILNYLNKKTLKDDMVIFDVGANIGHHSLFFSTLVKKVYAFEPYPKVRELLEKKITKNNIKNIEIIPLGLSQSSQRLEYFEPPDNNSGIGSFDPLHYSKNSKTGLFFEVIAGDDFVQKNAIKKIDFIKIDVEGFEHFVLEGLRESLNRYRPIIMMEFNKETQAYCKSYQNFIDLFPNNYLFYRLANPFGNMAKLKKFDFKTPKQINIICFPNKN